MMKINKTQSLSVFGFFPVVLTFVLALILTLALVPGLKNTAYAATDNMANFASSVLSGGSSSANFKGSVNQGDNGISSLIFEDNEPIDIAFSLTIDPLDKDLNSELFLVVNFNQQWFYRNKNGQWLAMADDMSNIESYTQKTLQATEIITVNSQQLLGPGEYLIYAAYRNHQSKLVYNKQALGFIIFSAESSNLHQFQSEQLFTSYFKKAIGRDDYTSLLSTDTSASGASVSGSPSTSNVPTSGTNVQEQGVDEADMIKTDGNRLFALDNCQYEAQKNCLSIYQINESPASNQLLSMYQFEDTNIKGSIYLTQIDTDDKTTDMLIRVAGSQNFYWGWWNYNYYWTNHRTIVDLLDVSQTESTQSLHNITLEGGLVSSRRINNTLYLVTRNSAVIDGYISWYPSEPVEGVTQAEIDANLQLLNNISLSDIIPEISFNDSNPTPLHQVNDCFLPPVSSQKYPNESLISITAIPLDNPQAYQSKCIVGSTETLYASSQSIYLASSRYNFESLESFPTDFFSIERFKTEIHKFSIGENNFDYKGSGSIPGNLGWETGKKSFRMGEYNNELRIASSLSSSATQGSSTSVSILKEAEEIPALEKIGGIDNLGKPNESLFATRFIGKRGYLVTFLRTDPLYVLDLEDGTNPSIITELEIDGFSDYLHPIGDNYLLGIGKSAIVTTDEAGIERSWTQGAKLSLFDVSGSDSVVEIQSMEIGKRPSYTSISLDHHTFSFLESHGNNPTRFAIPVNFYDTTPQYPYYEPDNPAYSYDWTHTGLYVFNLDTSTNPGFELTGKLITAETIPNYFYQGPRYGYSVIQGNSVHYFYNHKLYSSAISELEK